jgi:pimeloyl-ACP methyl ester carboxylesterase
MQIGSAKIYSEVVGAGPPVVLLHGLAGSSRWWEKNVGALAQSHEVHTIDLVGSGKSAGRFVLHETANILATWMERCDLERATLVGHSMGGHIAADMAATHPQLVERLILVDAALNIAGASQPAGQALSALSYLPFGMLPLIVPEALRAGLPKLAQTAMDLMKTDMGPALEQIRAPTLVVWGEHDPCVPLSFGYRLASMLPGKALAVISGAGHVPQWERPAAFNRVVTTFLNSHDGVIQLTLSMHRPGTTRMAS